MANRRIRQLEQEEGDLHKLIPPLVNEYGQPETARRLGVSQSTISQWLMRNGYVLKRQYVRENQVQVFETPEAHL